MPNERSSYERIIELVFRKHYKPNVTSFVFERAEIVRAAARLKVKTPKNVGDVRYNRLIDVFTGLTCYSMQNHLRTKILENVQIETDELYIGIDKRGAHYVLPVQAKGSGEHIGSVQIRQDFDLCADKFPNAMCRSIGAQFMQDDVIVLFEFELAAPDIKIVAEKHYRLVSNTDLTEEELEQYGKRPE